MTSPEHDVVVRPFSGITDGHVVTCETPGCDLVPIVYSTAADADERAELHRRYPDVE